jgi:hypothetical protein
MSKLASFKSAVQQNTSKSRAAVPPPFSAHPEQSQVAGAAFPALEACDGDGGLEPETLHDEALTAALRRSMSEIQSADSGVALLAATRIREILSQG